MVLDLSGVAVYTFTTRADEKGMWSTKIDAPLKKGQYRISALSRDKRQAQSLPILSQEITVNTRPIAVIFGFNLQAIHVIIGLLIVMFLGAVIGWYMNRMMKLQEERKITVSARDVSASFNVIRSDVKKALASLKRSDFKPDELNTLLTQVNATADKMEKYIISGIKEINKN
jgi:D-arabinose 1-dehydrogenase-like Zn-dependent alcohol dehydrogenase